MRSELARVDECDECEEDDLLPTAHHDSSKEEACPVPPNERHKRHKGRALNAARASNVWLRVDNLGNASLVTSDKWSLAMKLGVQPRDLRLLDPQMASVSPPAILDREHCIVVNLGSIKCIITLDYVLVVNPTDEMGGALVSELHNKLSNPLHVGKVMAYAGLSKLSDITRRVNGGALGLSFELKVLEISLDLVVTALDSQAYDIESVVLPALDKLTHVIRPGDLEVVRRMKNRLTRLMKRVEMTKEVLEKFLEDDEDMHRLNLTALEQGRQASMRADLQELLTAGASPLARSRSVSKAHSRTGSKHGSRHGSSHGSSSSRSSRSSGSSSSLDLQDEAEVAEVEMLLEAYQMHLDTTFNRLQTLQTFIKDAEDLVGTSLDTHRNRIIATSVALTSLFTALGLCTTISGLFGMNISQPFHQDGSTTFNEVAITGASIGPFALIAVFWLWAWRSRLLSR